MEYKAYQDNLWVTTGNSNGYGIPITVRVWDTDKQHYLVAWESTVCADSYRECVESALLAAGFEDDMAAHYCDSWGLEYPEDEED